MTWAASGTPRSTELPSSLGTAYLPPAQYHLPPPGSGTSPGQRQGSSVTPKAKVVLEQREPDVGVSEQREALPSSLCLGMEELNSSLLAPKTRP